MKTLEEYLKLSYKMEIVSDKDEGGFVVSFPELPGCLTCAETLQEAFESAEQAKREWLAAAIESGVDIPEPLTDESFSGQFKLRIPKSLHRSLSEHAKKEGISMNQYCIYLLSKFDSVR